MNRLVALVLWLAAASAGASPHLELDVDLDPEVRELDVSATISGMSRIDAIQLAPGLEITGLEVDGQARPLPRPDTADGQHLLRIAPADGRIRKVKVRYHGRLAPLADADHRQVLGRLPAMASAEGSYLPAGSGWYPDPGEAFTYRLRLRLPAGQKGLAAGRLSNETTTAEGYRADYDFAQPAEGIDLLAGPYEVSERTLTLPDGQAVRLRTWFHGDLADLADGYLTDAAAYVERYSRRIGAYPFADFSIVSSPLPTGFGMPGLTYLGRQVLRLPFIRATSLGHEILHNWWGNGVYPAWEQGNWSEGLTTFLADYAYKEDLSAAAAREARLGWLRDLAAVPESDDSALATFTSRRHGISSIVGYDKAAMVFFMLRDRIGQEAFDRGLRLVWEEKRFRSCSWSELMATFGRASGQDLGAFVEQWVSRSGAPRVTLAAAQQRGDRLVLTLHQTGTAYALDVPIRLHYSDRSEDRRVAVDTARSEATFSVTGTVEAVELDPDFRLWRRIDPAQFPAILREVFVAPVVDVADVDADPQMRAAAQALAARILDAEPVSVDGTADRPQLVLGSHAAVDRWLVQQGRPPRPGPLAGRGSAQVWAGRDAAGRAFVVVSARDAASMRALERGLPHYGRQSWLVFDGPRALDKGIWPAGSERVGVVANSSATAVPSP